MQFREIFEKYFKLIFFPGIHRKKAEKRSHTYKEFLLKMNQVKCTYLTLNTNVYRLYFATSEHEIGILHKRLQNWMKFLSCLQMNRTKYTYENC